MNFIVRNMRWIYEKTMKKKGIKQSFENGFYGLVAKEQINFQFEIMVNYELANKQDISGKIFYRRYVAIRCCVQVSTL